MGVGIAVHHLDQLFSAFFTTKPGGMGMGPSISRSIIEAHRGRLWATPDTPLRRDLPLLATSREVAVTGRSGTGQATTSLVMALSDYDLEAVARLPKALDHREPIESRKSAISDRGGVICF